MDKPGTKPQSAEPKEQQDTYSAGDRLARSRTAGPTVHLRDLLVVLFTGNPQEWPDRDKAALQRRDLAFTLALKMLEDNWEGIFNSEAVFDYVATKWMERGIETRLQTETAFGDGRDAGIAAEIRRLHKAGLTPTILAALCTKYPDVANATRLDRAKAQRSEAIPQGGVSLAETADRLTRAAETKPVGGATQSEKGPGSVAGRDLTNINIGSVGPGATLHLGNHHASSASRPPKEGRGGRWSRTHKFALVGIVLAFLTLVGMFVVPEGRRFIGLSPAGGASSDAHQIPASAPTQTQPAR